MRDIGFPIEILPSRTEIDAFHITPEMMREAHLFYQEHRGDLLEAAALSRETAVSWREKPFKVGCAVLAIEPGLESGSYAVYQAGNFKPQPRDVSGSAKRCAERNALEAAREHARRVVAIVTVSKERSTGDEQRSHDVLHPCSDCREMLRELQEEGFVTDDTVVCNGNDTQTPIRYEERTLGELLRLYDDEG